MQAFPPFLKATRSGRPVSLRDKTPSGGSATLERLLACMETSSNELTAAFCGCRSGSRRRSARKALSMTSGLLRSLPQSVVSARRQLIEEAVGEGSSVRTCWPEEAVQLSCPAGRSRDRRACSGVCRWARSSPPWRFSASGSCRLWPGYPWLICSLPWLASVRRRSTVTGIGAVRRRRRCTSLKKPPEVATPPSMVSLPVPPSSASLSFSAVERVRARARRPSARNRRRRTACRRRSRRRARPSWRGGAALVPLAQRVQSPRPPRSDLPRRRRRR